MTYQSPHMVPLRPKPKSSDEPAKQRVPELDPWRFCKGLIWCVAGVFGIAYIFSVGIAIGVVSGLWRGVKREVGGLLAKDIRDMRSLWEWVLR